LKTPTRRRIVDVDELDERFSQDVLEKQGGEKLRTCLQCGLCVASCPVRLVDERYNPRRLIKMVQLGMRHQVLSSETIWMCSFCYTCHERCPQDVKFPDLVNAIRNLAVEQGYIHPSFEKLLSIIKQHDRMYEIDDFTNLLRTQAGLPEIQEKPKAVQKIFSMIEPEKTPKGRKK